MEVVVVSCVAITIILVGIQLVLTRKLAKVRPYFNVIGVGVALIFIGLCVLRANWVYILKEQNGGYEAKVLLFTTHYKLANGRELELTPRTGLSAIVVNDTKYKATFETVAYGAAQHKPKVILPTFTVTYIKDKVDYILTSPPSASSSKGVTTYKGWLHF